MSKCYGFISEKQHQKQYTCGSSVMHVYAFKTSFNVKLRNSASH